jgi:hypothetical protein
LAAAGFAAAALEGAFLAAGFFAGALAFAAGLAALAAFAGAFALAAGLAALALAAGFAAGLAAAFAAGFFAIVISSTVAAATFFPRQLDSVVRPMLPLTRGILEHDVAALGRKHKRASRCPGLPEIADGASNRVRSLIRTFETSHAFWRLSSRMQRFPPRPK